MPSIKKTQETPLTLELDLNLYEALQRLKKSGQYKSISEIIRKSIKSFDFDTVERCGPEKKQMSVRIPDKLKKPLQEVSDEAGVSIGNLIRRCLVQFLKGDPGDPEKTSSATPEVSEAVSVLEETSYNGKRLINFKQESQSFALDEAQIAAVLAARKELEALMEKSSHPSGQEQPQNSSPAQPSQGSSKSPDEDPWDLQI